jgi:hypothetical protein
MAQATGGKIERFEDLYAYLEKRPKEYRIESQGSVKAVYLLGPSGNRLKETIPHPVIHQRLCVYYFDGIEVSRPQLTIPENTIAQLIDRLDLPRNIFRYPPS